jgi:hypothetical protein
MSWAFEGWDQAAEAEKKLEAATMRIAALEAENAALRELRDEIISTASNEGIYDGEDPQSALECIGTQLHCYSRLMWRIEELCNIGSARPDDVLAGIQRALFALREDKARLVNIARGCHDYGGGYAMERDAEVYHHGIQTVINALEAAVGGDCSLQTKVLESIGIDAARKEAPDA